MCARVCVYSVWLYDDYETKNQRRTHTYIDGTQVDFYGFQFGMKKQKEIKAFRCDAVIDLFPLLLILLKCKRHFIYSKRFYFDSIRNYNASSISTLFNWYVMFLKYERLLVSEIPILFCVMYQFTDFSKRTTIAPWMLKQMNTHTQSRKKITRF